MIELLNIDCMEYMATCKNKQFDLAIVDPPYGIGANKEKPHNGWADWGIKQWDNNSPNKNYFDELLRISKHQIIWGANHFISKIPYDSSGWIVWDKGQRDFSLADGELAWTDLNKALRIYTYSRAKALQEGKIHPTQKPIQLYKWLLANYATPDMKIIDTHLGSGSSAIAAYDFGCDFVGCEIDKEYYESAKHRFETYKLQTKLCFT